eukprot:1020-Heterococcus_DN1.PRE.3
MICTLCTHTHANRPGCIVRDLNLRKPIFQKTAAYCHFGREDPDFTWECARSLALRAASSDTNSFDCLSYDAALFTAGAKGAQALSGDTQLHH